MELQVNYTWLRGTADNGERSDVDRVTIDARKKSGVRNLVSNLSNVNHWMMSHDNVWMTLGPQHPAILADRRRRTKEAAKQDAKKVRFRSSGDDAQPASPRDPGAAAGRRLQSRTLM